jgi:2-polyprenyl-3-methyl-5-hydroxy-6-metoxy-1,4-benzoquinol methylase
MQWLMPAGGHVTITGCDYGFMSYMLHFLDSTRTITGIDIDEEKVNVANNCYSKNRQLNFERGDMLTYNYQPSDVFVIENIPLGLDKSIWSRFLKLLSENLNPGGIIILNDIKRKIAAETIKEVVLGLSLQFQEIGEAEYGTNPIFVIRNK